MRKYLSAIAMVIVIVLSASMASAQPGARPTTVSLNAAAPVFILPDSRRIPLVVLKEGSSLTLLDVNGEWCQVEFDDAQLGTRTGYVQTKFVRIPPQVETPKRPVESLPAQLVTPPVETVSVNEKPPRTIPIRPAVYVHLGLGGTKEDRASGGATVFGLSVRIGPVWASVTPADLILRPGDSYPYYRDTFSNGESACRNSINGQFARDSDCLAVDVTYAASADAAFLIPRTPLLVGFGRRFGSGPDLWFGAAGIGWLSKSGRVAAIVKANVGASSYASGLATLAIRLGPNR